MAIPSSTIVMLLSFFMLPTILGLMSQSDSSLPFMEHCAVKNSATYCTLEGDNKDIKLRGEESKMLERSSEEGEELVESSEKRTTSWDAESGECIKLKREFDVSDAEGGFPAALLIPVMIFLVLLYFGSSFLVYVVIPLFIFMLFFALFTT